jgi:Uma2 family endonuclease
VAHSLAHQILVSDLVVPLALAQSPDQETLPRFGTRLADDTCLRADVIVVDSARLRDGAWYVDGPPSLAIEVTSDASAPCDLGAKKDMWARYGVPSYWVVQPGVRQPRLYVFELNGDGYVERAKLTGDRPYLVKQPFEMELVPSEIFGRLRNRPSGKGRTTTMTEQTGMDLPPPDERIMIDTFGYRWPTGAEKAELWDGCPVFYGVWDARDVAIAQRAYPGRVIQLDQDPGKPGTLRVLPSEPAKPAEPNASEAAQAGQGGDAAQAAGAGGAAEARGGQERRGGNGGGAGRGAGRGGGRHRGGA